MRAFANLLCIAGVLLGTGAPASAFGYWEEMFGAGPRDDYAPDWREPPPRRDWSRPPAARRRAVEISRPRPHPVAPVDTKMADYLRSEIFTGQMANGAPEAAGAAVAYLLKHDQTLRPGDALVTAQGVVVFEEDGGREFVPVADSELRSGVRTRLLAVQPAAPSKAVQTPAIVLSPEPFGAQRVGFSPVDGSAIRIEGAPSGEPPKPFAVRPR